MNPRIDYSSSPRGRSGGLLNAGPFSKALAIVAGGMMLVAGLFVSAVVFSVLLVGGVVAGGWFWWKTRDIRKQLGERMAQMQQMQAGRRPPGAPPGSADSPDPSDPSNVIDGDYIRETERPTR